MDEEVQEENPAEILEEEEVEGGEDNAEETEQEEETEEPEAKEEVLEEPTVDPDDFEVETRGEDDIEYGEDIDPDDAKTIGAIVKKETASVKDQMEVNAFVAENPQYKKYAPVVLKYLKNDVYSKIPPKNIFAMVASNDLMKMGAEAEREAQTKADATKTKGTTVRKPQGGQQDWSKVSKEDFEAQKREVLGQS